MSKKSLAVAQRILDLSRASSRPCVTPMKLLKLIYIAHGYMMGRYQTPLIEENIQAYEYGPIVESVYRKVRSHRSMPVATIKGSSAWRGSFTARELEVMQDVINLYGPHTAITLSQAMKHPSTPWSITRESSNRDTRIPNELIESFYKKQLGQSDHSHL